MARLFKKIILASNQADLVGLVPLLVQQGLEVHHCRDGAQALEQSLSLFPDMMVLDTGIPLLPAPRLAQILLSNPRTERIAFFYIGREGEEVDGYRRHKDCFVPRPFNPEQLLVAVLGHFGRLEKTEQVGRQETEIRGNLNQISVTDLVQVLGVNRKEGVLSLSGVAGRGTIFMREGSVINARIGRVDGDKAFFRLLDWGEGDFWFSPGAVDVEVRINVPVDHLVIDGLRQLDEMKAQIQTLPSAASCLEMKVPRDRLPRGLRPTTQEILILAEYYPLVQDILDHCPRPDFEVLQVLKVLIEKGVLEERKEGLSPELSRIPLLTSDEIIVIKDHLGERDVLLDEASAKLILLAATAADIRSFVQTLQGISEFEPAHDFLLGVDDSLGLGDVGRLMITETFSLRLFALPATAETGPLWTPFCRRLLGVVSLAEGGQVTAAEEFFKHRSRVPVVSVGYAEPAAGTFLLKRGDRLGFRELLAFFATHFRRSLPAREDA
jgi:CheY-like chemotaxis protein